MPLPDTIAAELPEHYTRLPVRLEFRLFRIVAKLAQPAEEFAFDIAVVESASPAAGMVQAEPLEAGERIEFLEPDLVGEVGIRVAR